jgi:histidyl-tRNA synthetase
MSEEQKNLQSLMQAPRGMRDILPRVRKNWDFVISRAHQIAQMGGFEEIETPMLEAESIFTRAVGEATDIVTKEMFVIEPKADSEGKFSEGRKEKLVLRPEGTAGVVRAYIEHGMHTRPQPLKLYYIGPMFRHDRPQAGRFRQFWQFGLEILGDGGSVTDAELISLLYKYFQTIGLTDISFNINSIGAPECCRQKYINRLVDFLEPHKVDLAEEDRKRLKTNPLRILDSKEESTIKVLENAPMILDFLCEKCQGEFKEVLEYLDELGIPYDLNPKLVRGLDYYTRTTFEIVRKEDNASLGSLGGGGRYDGLVKKLGGLFSPAVGAALGLDRIIHALLESKVDIVDESIKTKVFVIGIGDLAKRIALKIEKELWDQNIPSSSSLGKPSVRSQLKAASRLEAPFAIIIGQREALDGTVILRDMRDGVQDTVLYKNYLNKLLKKLEKVK